ncbi:MAG: hypothetical protein WGN25_14795 [Candidatus Electrothrix sp. GW3-4]|uniref:hypothetical protein n=1 Tax=Candidatus Electrothrix sp. GW3-4 TaxID=3126740 RepID=UPI0030CD0E98
MRSAVGKNGPGAGKNHSVTGENGPTGGKNHPAAGESHSVALQGHFCLPHPLLFQKILTRKQ